jgi:hypothetical protein
MLLMAVGEDKSLQCSVNLFTGLSELRAGQQPPCRHAVGRCSATARIYTINGLLLRELPITAAGVEFSQYPSGVEYFVINFGAVALNLFN